MSNRLKHLGKCLDTVSKYLDILRLVLKTINLDIFRQFLEHLCSLMSVAACSVTAANANASATVDATTAAAVLTAAPTASMMTTGLSAKLAGRLPARCE